MKKSKLLKSLERLEKAYCSRLKAEQYLEILEKHPANTWIRFKTKADPHFAVFKTLADIGLLCEMRVPLYQKDVLVAVSSRFFYNLELDYSKL